MKRFLSITLWVLFACAGQSMAMEREWRFQATLDDKPIGYHNFSLRESNGQRVLTSQANFQVKFLLIQVYNYDHNATEQWSGNCLRGIQSITNDNGDRFSVNGAVRDDRFIVKTQSGQTRLPGCVMTFAYWNPEILEQKLLLNTQTGDYEKVDVRFQGQEPFPVGGKEVAANRYQLRADGKEITLWYAKDDGHWLGLESVVEGGYKLRYELLGLAPQAGGVRVSQR